MGMMKLEKVKKVILSLERCTCNVPDACQDCPYDVYPYPICNQKLDRDALELLKEQEPVEYVVHCKNANLSNGTEFACGECGGSLLHKKVNYCPWCGKAVKWDG